ncbi:SGNH/GDSL hydrolase family protein [Paenibacillus sp. CAU 1782]
MNGEQTEGLELYDRHMAVRRTNEDSKEEGGLIWHDPGAEPFRLSGFPWFSDDRLYRRLPRYPSERLPDAVDWLADCTAGGQIAFVTDSEEIHIRAELKEGASMYHMAPSGQCGFDCYVGEPGRRLHVGTASFTPGESKYASLLFRNKERRRHMVTIHFPLYQGVVEAAVGLSSTAGLEPPLPYDSDGKVIVYGTSITQGGCASRPGMAYPAQLARGINLEFVNLGFSGSGKGEPEMARVIADIHDPAALVLDYEANCGGIEMLAATLPSFIAIYRKRHPHVPILLISRITPPSADMDEELAESLRERRNYQWKLVEELNQKGDRLIRFLDGGELLGARFGDSTVDGIHPTDLGFASMAEGILPVLRGCLESAPENS